MTELRVTMSTAPVSANIEEVKDHVRTVVARYAGLVYDEDQMKLAKQDKAELNRLKKHLDECRKRTQAEYMAPFNEFKAEVDALIASVNDAVTGISAQLDAAEDHRKELKRGQIAWMFDRLTFPEFVTLDMIFNKRWLNATYAINTIQEDMETLKAKILAEWQMCEHLPNWRSAVKTYEKTLSLEAAMTKSRELEEAKQALEAAQKDDEAEKPAESVPVQGSIAKRPDEAVSERKWVAVDLYMTCDEAKALGHYLKTNGITYRRGVRK